MIDFQPIKQLVFDAESACTYLGLKSVRSLKNLVQSGRMTPLKIAKDRCLTIHKYRLSSQICERSAGPG